MVLPLHDAGWLGVRRVLLLRAANGRGRRQCGLLGTKHAGREEQRPLQAARGTNFHTQLAELLCGFESRGISRSQYEQQSGVRVLAHTVVVAWTADDVRYETAYNIVKG